MNIAVLEGHVCNPGDLTWEGMKRFGEVTVYDRTPRATMKERLVNADIAIANKVIWDEEAFSWAPNLKLIALASTGYNVVDLDAARAHGVTVCNVPAYSTPDVAQMTFALMLGLCLHVEDHTRMVMEGDWIRANDFCFWSGSLIELAGKTLGIVGMGSIGAGGRAHRPGVRHACPVREPQPQTRLRRRRHPPSGTRRVAAGIRRGLAARTGRRRKPSA